MNVFPIEHYVSTIGGAATFTCSVPPDGSIIGVQWLVNGSELEGLNLPNVEAMFELHDGIGSGILRFRNVSVEYNETSITCIATTVAMRRLHATDSSSLLVQGTN